VRQRKVTDFAHHHHDMVDWWRRIEDSPRLGGPSHSRANFRQYLAWYHSATRYKLRQKWMGDDYADIASSKDEDTSYDIRTREGTVVEIAPILDRVGSSVMRSVHNIDNTLRYPIGSPGNGGRMREMLEVR
jgi:hypothetical protein